MDVEATYVSILWSSGMKIYS